MFLRRLSEACLFSYLGEYEIGAPPTSIVGVPQAIELLGTDPIDGAYFHVMSHTLVLLVGDKHIGIRVPSIKANGYLFMEMLNRKRFEKVRASAYDLWETRGRPEGLDNEIWLEAEKLLEAEFKAPSFEISGPHKE